MTSTHWVPKEDLIIVYMKYQRPNKPEKHSLDETNDNLKAFFLLLYQINKRNKQEELRLKEVKQ